MQAKTHQGRHTARWQYGAEVTDRAPLRESGAFYATTRPADEDEDEEPTRSTEGFVARVASAATTDGGETEPHRRRTVEKLTQREGDL